MLTGNSAPFHITQPSTDYDAQIVSPTATRATLTCSLNISISSDVIVTWLHNGTITLNNVTQAGGTTVLIIKNPQPSDAGVYQCVFDDSGGSGWVLQRSTRLFIGGSLFCYVTKLYSTIGFHDQPRCLHFSEIILHLMLFLSRRTWNSSYH